MVGAARSDMSDDEYRELARESIKKYSRTPPDEKLLGNLLESIRYVPGSFDQREPYEKIAPDRDGARWAGGAPAQPHLLPLDGTGFLPGDHRDARRDGPQPAPRRRGAGGHREADRARPRLRARAQPPRAVRVRGEPGLPDRPLPRQGDGAEHAGSALRQRHLRAALEPRVRGPRADHGGGGHRDRHARGLLRPVGRAARPHPEPHAAAADAARHGAARVVLRRRRARREGEGAARDQGARSRAGAGHGGAGAVLGRRRGRRGGAGLPRGGGRAGRIHHGDLCRAPPVRGQLALGRRAVLPAHRQAPGPQDHGDRRDAQAGAAPRLRAARLAGRAAQPADLLGAAERGRVALAGGQDPRRQDARAAGEHGVPLRHVVHLPVARGLRAPHPRHDARRRHALRAQRRGGGGVAHLRPHPGGLVAHARSASAVPRGHTGAGGGGWRSWWAAGGGRCEGQRAAGSAQAATLEAAHCALRAAP